ncbi:MAG TPA: hypothetical protein VE422_12400 [Terriglobia bacterium]|nr:hypothetical protein [Terriglobia bacterium]
MHRNVRVQIEPIHAGASRTERKIHAFGVDLITNSSYATTGIGTICCSAGYRGCVKPGQPRLIASKRIRFFRIAVRSQATTIEQLRNSLSERRRQARNFIIVWSQQDLKSRTIVVIGGVDAIECEHVDMKVEP